MSQERRNPDGTERAGRKKAPDDAGAFSLLGWILADPISI
jgi:hypothetical protein